MLTPAPDAFGQTLAVNQDNVLAVRRAILSAATDAMRELDGMRLDLEVVGSAQDGISARSAEFWNHGLLTGPDSHFNRLRQYVTYVWELGRQVEEAARKYGYTEEEIAASVHRPTEATASG